MTNRYVILVPLLLACVVHLVNPVGFPDISFDEGIYMRRAMNMLDTGNPQEGYLYDHPYFGQIVLAGVLHATGYPHNEMASDPASLQNLYLIPRLFMGMVAVLSTFLLYHIAREWFDRTIALVSSVLFAVTPYAWVLDRILLDSLFLPFLLASILLAIRFTRTGSAMWLAPASGILLGIAIFTKVPAFAFIPLLAWLIFQKRKRYTDIFACVIPILLIPLIWPANSMVLGQFDMWLDGVMWQGQRSSSILETVEYFLKIDPVLFVIGMAGVAYSVIVRNKFVLFWFIPFIAFLSLVGFKQYFHWIPLVPILCICASMCMLNVGKRIKYSWIKTVRGVIVVSILVFGLTSTLLVTTNDISYNQFEALSYVLENHNDIDTILAGPQYSWILYDVYGIDNVPLDYTAVLFYPVETRNVTVIADSHFMVDISRGPELFQAYHNTDSVMYFEGRVADFNNTVYPYTGMAASHDAYNIDIRKGMWNKP
ncbi:MAG: glycosyltransferase family 39 protein [Thaumarchaeota archaeon]|nr:glycosyltransferase family 39 protein [Nitrososphaerota archaeon]